MVSDFSIFLPACEHSTFLDGLIEIICLHEVTGLPRGAVLQNHRFAKAQVQWFITSDGSINPL
jgi:hypothetical protein